MPKIQFADVRKPIRFPNVLNNLNKLVAKLNRKRYLSAVTRTSDNINAGSMIFQGKQEDVSTILHKYFMVKNPPIKAAAQFIVFSENDCDEQAFFEKLCKEVGGGVKQDFPYNESATPKDLAKKFIAASSQKSYVLVIPDIDKVSPRILSFINLVLKKEESAHMDNKASINITLIMGLEKKETYSAQLQRIIEEHGYIQTPGANKKRKLVDTDDLEDFVIDTVISPTQDIILSIIGLFGTQKIDVEYLATIFKDKKTFIINQGNETLEVAIGELEFREHLNLLIKTAPLLTKYEENDKTYVALQNPHQLPFILKHLPQRSCEGQSLHEMVLTQHPPAERQLLVPLLLSNSAPIGDMRQEADDLVISLQEHIANNDDENINPTISRLIEIINMPEFTYAGTKAHLIKQLKLFRIRTPSEAHLQELSSQERLVLSIIALLGHHRIAFRALQPLFLQQNLTVVFEGQNIELSNEQLNEILHQLSEDQLFLSKTNDGKQIYFSSPKLLQHFAALGEATPGLVNKLLIETSLTSNEPEVAQAILGINRPAKTIDAAALRKTALSLSQSEKSAAKVWVTDDEAFLSSKVLFIELLLLQEKITDLDQANLLSLYFETLVKNEEFEEAYSISTKLLNFYLEHKPEPQIVFKLWQNRILYRPKNEEENTIVQQEVRTFIESQFFSNLLAEQKFDYLRLFLFTVSTTFMSLLGDEQGLGRIIFNIGQELSAKGNTAPVVASAKGKEKELPSKGIILSADLRPDSTLDLDTQKAKLYDYSEKFDDHKELYKSLDEKIIDLDKKYQKLLTYKDEENTAGSCILDAINDLSFEDFFKKNGINNFKDCKKFFALRLLKMSGHKIGDKLSTHEQNAISKLAFEKRTELLTIIKETKYYERLIIQLFQAQEIPAAFGLVQSAINNFISNDIYPPNMFYFVAMFLVLERLGLSRDHADTKDIYKLLKAKIKFQDVEAADLELVQIMKGKQKEEKSAKEKKKEEKREEKAEAEKAALAKKYTEDVAKDEPLIKALTCVLALGFEKISKEHMQLLQNITETSSNAGDIVSYITATYTQLKAIEQTEANLKIRHIIRNTLITRMTNYILTQNPTQVIVILHIFATIWLDQILLKGDGRPAISDMILNELLETYENLYQAREGGPTQLMAILEKYLTPAEYSVYEINKLSLPAYIKLKVLLALSGNLTGVSDFCNNQMSACIARYTADPNSAANLEKVNNPLVDGIQVAKVFLEEGLVSGLRGRPSEAAAISSILMLLKLRYGDIKKIDDPIFTDFIIKSKMEKLISTAVNKAAGASVKFVDPLARIAKITKHTPGSPYYTIAELALLALQQDSKGVKKLFDKTLEEIDGKQLMPSAELISALTNAIEWCPEVDRQYLASKVLNLARINQVSMAIKTILQKYPESDEFGEKVKAYVANVTEEQFVIPLEIRNDDIVRAIAPVCKPPHNANKFTLPTATLTLLKDIFAAFDLDFSSIDVPITMVKKEGDTWSILSRNVKADLKNKAKFRFKAVDAKVLEKTIPVKFLEGIAPFSIVEIPDPWKSEGDPHYNPSGTRPLESAIGISFGNYKNANGDECHIYCFFADHPITFSPEAVHARAFAKHEAHLLKEALAKVDQKCNSMNEAAIKADVIQRQVTEIYDKATVDDFAAGMTKATLTKEITAKIQASTPQEIEAYAQQIRERETAAAKENVMKEMQHFVNTAAAVDFRIGKMGDSQTSDMPKVVDPLKIAVFHKLIQIYSVNPQLWKQESTTQAALSSTTNYLQEGDNFSVLSIQPLLMRFGKDNFIIPEAFERILNSLGDLEDSYPEHIIEQRKLRALQCLKDFNSEAEQANIRESTPDIQKVVYENIQTLFDFGIVSSFYDLNFEMSKGFLKNVKDLEKVPGIERGHGLSLFINQADFHNAMQAMQRLNQQITLESIRHEIGKLTYKADEGDGFIFYLVANYALHLCQKPEEHQLANVLIQLVRELSDAVYIDSEIKDILLDQNKQPNDDALQEALFNAAQQVSFNFGDELSKRPRAASIVPKHQFKPVGLS